MRELMNHRNIRVLERTNHRQMTGPQNLVLSYGTVQVSIAMMIEHHRFVGTSLEVSRTTGQVFFTKDNCSAEDIAEAILFAKENGEA